MLSKEEFRCETVSVSMLAEFNQKSTPDKPGRHLSKGLRLENIFFVLLKHVSNASDIFITNK